jgi:hypothetical protein
MKRKFVYLFLMATLVTQLLCAQSIDESSEEEKRGFKKEKLFTGGNIALSFFNNTFLAGASPIFGYSLTNWADAGVVANISYSSTRDYNGLFNAKLRQTIYGGGAFVRLFPVNFLFVQAQAEHNFIAFKYIPPDNSGGITQKDKTSVNSLLVGAGYTQGRQPGNNGFFYLSVMFDVSGNKNSPYTDNFGRTIPVIRAGVNVPLFQKN